MNSLLLFILSLSFFSTFEARANLQLEQNLQVKTAEVKEQKLKPSAQIKPAKTKSPKLKHKPRKITRVKVPEGSCTKELLVRKTIGPATFENLTHALEVAEKDGCSSMLLLINTPGGSLLSTRKIVEVILNSPLPILCMVYPSGAHAGSAGAIILQACHVNGALETTNLGAATPITGGGQDMSKDLRKKVINDTTSWMDSLTELRKRNKQFGRDIIIDAKAVSAKEAHELGAIDFVGKTKEDFLKFSHGIEVQVKEKEKTPVVVGSLQEIPQGIRYHFVNFITDPEFVYLLFLAGIALIYFEITHAGFILPGTLGMISLTLALIGMHKLSFAWGGLVLIILGLVLMIAEVFVTSFGALAVSGMAAFIAGSLFLFDPDQTGGLTIPISLILTSAVIFGSLVIGVSFLAFSTLKKTRLKEEETWIGTKGTVVQVKSKSEGLFEIQGETWKYKSAQELKKGDKVTVLEYHGMAFSVEKEKGDV